MRGNAAPQNVNVGKGMEGTKDGIFFNDGLRERERPFNGHRYTGKRILMGAWAEMFERITRR